MKAIRHIVSVPAGILLVAAVNSSLTGLAKVSPIGKATGKNKTARRAYYGLLGAATAYRFVRSLGPKTKEEQRAERVAHLFDQAETYQKRASVYRRAADAFLRKRFQGLK